MSLHNFAIGDPSLKRLYLGRNNCGEASFYDVGGFVTGSPARVKIETLRRRLLGGDQHAMALLVSADEAQGGGSAVDRFLAALGPVQPAFVGIAGGR